MTYISAVLGNSQQLDGGAMFGNAPRPVWEKWIAPDEIGRIPLACRTLLVEHDGQKILFETGIGAFFEPKMATRFGVQDPERHLLLENLNALGIKPEDIDWVVLSHLHFDHAGGLLPTHAQMQAGENGLVFPNATIVVSEDALARARKPHSRDRASFIPELMKRLESAKLQVIKNPQTDSLFDGRLRFFTSNGHTPGQMHSIFKGDKESIVFCADLIPGMPWVHLPITMGYDRYPELLIDEKEQLYASLDLNTANFFFTHDPQVAMAKVHRDEKGKYSGHQEIKNPVHLSL